MQRSNIDPKQILIYRTYWASVQSTLFLLFFIMYWDPLGDCFETFSVLPQEEASVSLFPTCSVGSGWCCELAFWVLVLRVNMNKFWKHLLGYPLLWHNLSCPRHLEWARTVKWVGIIQRGSRWKTSNRIGMAQNVWDNFSAGKRKDQADHSTKRNRGTESSVQVTGTMERGWGSQ